MSNWRISLNKTQGGERHYSLIVVRSVSWRLNRTSPATSIRRIPVPMFSYHRQWCSPGYHCPWFLGRLTSMYRWHEQEKKRQYEQCVREVKDSTFTPSVMSTTGGKGRAAITFCKRLASMLSEKRDAPYSETLRWICCRLGFALLQSSNYVHQRSQILCIPPGLWGNASAYWPSACWRSYTLNSFKVIYL